LQNITISFYANQEPRDEHNDLIVNASNYANVFPAGLCINKECSPKRTFILNYPVKNKAVGFLFWF
jgi:hypothetical protein